MELMLVARGQDISIDSGGRLAATAPQQQMRTVSRFQPPQQAEYGLVLKEIYEDLRKKSGGERQLER